MGRKNRPPVKKTPYERPEKYNRKKDRRNKHKHAPREPLFRLSQIPYAIIILAYVFVVTFTPNWMALDTNTSKFMTLSFLNLAVFIYLLFDPAIRKNPGILQRFFDTKAGLAYTGFLIIVLLSFTQAINILESVLQFSKLFSVFSAVFILTVILIQDIRYVKLLILAGTGMLIFDSISVYYYIDKFIQGEINTISDIKSVYSNKNILASAIFVKIPFALWLWVFHKNWLGKIGLLGVALGILATFFMATRGFYVGLIIISLVFLAYTLHSYFREKEIRFLRLLGGYFGALVLALLIFSVVQSNLYPDRGRHTQGVGQQIASIQGDASTSVRIDSWLWSIDILKENPLLGVGAGNWKINILEYENQTKTDYIYLFKAHNDFVEIAAETGIIGGILYVSIFVFVFWYLFRAYIKREFESPYYKTLFLAGFGLMFYGFDALFNFPVDRPEIQILFAIFLSVGIASAWVHDQMKRQGALEGAEALPDSLPRRRPWLIRSLSVLAILLMLGTSYTLVLNYQSSKLQRVIYQDIMRGNLNNEADKFLEEFPAIPNLSVWGESITSTIARYLLQENRHREVIDLLRDDHTNPFDSRREFFMATAYNNLGLLDSALVYSKKVYKLKPNYFRNIHMLSNLLEGKSHTEEIGPMLDNFLAQVKTDKQAYLFTTSFYVRQNNLEQAWDHIKEAFNTWPDDTQIEQQYKYIEHQKFILPYRNIYTRATENYNNQNYEQALPYLNEFIEKTPFEPNAYRMRAFSNYHLGNYEKTIEDINYVFGQGTKDPSLINLRGVCFQALGNREAACVDFREAMEAGNASGEQNYRNFCGGRE